MFNWRVVSICKQEELWRQSKEKDYALCRIRMYMYFSRVQKKWDQTRPAKSTEHLSRLTSTDANRMGTTPHYNSVPIPIHSPF